MKNKIKINLKPKMSMETNDRLHPRDEAIQTYNKNANQTIPSGKSTTVFNNCSNITVNNDCLNNDIDKSITKIIDYLEKKDRVKERHTDFVLKLVSECIGPVSIALIKSVENKTTASARAPQPMAKKKTNKKTKSKK